MGEEEWLGLCDISYFRPRNQTDKQAPANQLTNRITHIVFSYSQNILQEPVEFGCAENVVNSTL
jgi:hypothetical protein